MYTGTTSMEISVDVPQKPKNRPIYDPTIPPLDMYPKKYKSVYKRDNCVLIFIAVLFTMDKLKLDKVPKNQSVDKETKYTKKSIDIYVYIYIYVCIYI
jgi:hypothetical protein